MRSHTPSLALLVIVAACGRPEPPAVEPDPTEALYAAPAPQPTPPLELVAVVTSRISKVVAAETDGRVERLLVHGDDRVRAGDVIAQLDVAELRARLEEARAQRARARGEAGRAYAISSQARRRVRLERRLVNTGAAAPESLRSAMSEARAARASGATAAGEIRQAEASIAELERLIAAATIRAPLDGVVSTVQVKEGEIARKGIALARVFDPGELQLKFALPRAHRELVTEGQRVELVYGDDRRAAATVTGVVDDHDPAIDFLQVIAALPPDARPDDLRVGIVGHVPLAIPQRGAHR